MRKIFQIHFTKIALVVSLLLSLTKASIAQDNIPTTKEKVSETKNTSRGQQSVMDTNCILVRGYVYDENSKAVPEAIVKGYDNNFTFIGQCITNKEGYYEIALSNFKIGTILNITLENKDSIVKQFTIVITDALITYNLLIRELQIETISNIITNICPLIRVEPRRDNSSNWIFIRQFLRARESAY